MSFKLSKDKPFLFQPELSNKTIINYCDDWDNPDFLEKYEKIKNEDWYYKDAKIEYKHNEFGYRSDLISDIQENDYLLSFGCSYTYGWGLHNEDRYSSIVADYYNLKNINMGINGSGISYHLLNTTLFINYLMQNHLRLPKLVIYQYPSWTRMKFTSIELDKNQNQLLAQHTHNFDNFDKNITPYYKKHWVMEETEPMTESLYAPLQFNLIWNGYGVPAYQMDWGDYLQKYKSDFQSFHLHDYSDLNRRYTENETTFLLNCAKDLSHNGRDFNRVVGNDIIQNTKEWLM